MKKVRSITVIGRRWRDKINGNTYHTAQIMVNGVTVHKTTHYLGYEDQYIQTAIRWLEQNSYILRRCDHELLEQLLKNTSGVAFEHFAIDVQRKKNL